MSINNHQWSIPKHILAHFPTLTSIIEQVGLPVEEKEDYLLWEDNESGELNIKDAYLFKNKHNPQLQWPKNVWCRVIPPARSFVD